MSTVVTKSFVDGTVAAATKAESLLSRVKVETSRPSFSLHEARRSRLDTNPDILAWEDEYKRRQSEAENLREALRVALLAVAITEEELVKAYNSK